MRADGARRRAAILREARHLFATSGGDVPLETVAAAAGVGIATLYRNFESRGALADEVVLATFADMAAAATEALEEAAHDPDAAWTRFVGRLVDLELGAVTAALAEHADGDLTPDVRDAQDRTLAAVGEVLTAARAAGVVRAELSPLELVLAVGMITRPQPAVVHQEAPDLVPHLVTVLLAGLRAGGSGG